MLAMLHQVPLQAGDITETPQTSLCPVAPDPCCIWARRHQTGHPHGQGNTNVWQHTPGQH